MNDAVTTWEQQLARQAVRLHIPTNPPSAAVQQILSLRRQHYQSTGFNPEAELAELAERLVEAVLAEGETVPMPTAELDGVGWVHLALLRHAHRCADSLRCVREPHWLQRGLTAVLLEAVRTGMAETGVALGDLSVAAMMRGINPIPQFRTAAERAGPVCPQLAVALNGVLIGDFSVRLKREQWLDPLLHAWLRGLEQPR